MTQRKDRQRFDRIVIGGGLYGLYSALKLSEKGLKVLVLEYDKDFFQRASYINQARLHNGYHYPRSYSTAEKSARYFKKFNDTFGFAINNKFKQIYALSRNHSYTTGDQFAKFCAWAKIPCKEINVTTYLNQDVVEKAYETTEFSFDASKIKSWFYTKLKEFSNLEFIFNARVGLVENDGKSYSLTLKDGPTVFAPVVLNATYASVNQVLDKFNFDKFAVKYELCEVALCEVEKSWKNLGVTVMDGPFFSIMPFNDKLHSLTSVIHTPRLTSHNSLPTFLCQKLNELCEPDSLDNCNSCPVKPESDWVNMLQLAKKYLIPNVQLRYNQSLFAVKPILKTSEVDDSRPTLIKKFSADPTFISVLSGKINTIFDLDEVLV